MVGIVLIAQVMALISDYFVPTFFITKKMQLVAAVYALSAITNVAFNLILIPKMGIMGAAVATLISYGIMAGVLYIESQRLIRIDINFQSIFITAIITAAIWYLLLNMGVANPLLSLVLKMLTLTPVLVISAMWLYRRRSQKSLVTSP